MSCLKAILLFFTIIIYTGCSTGPGDKDVDPNTVSYTEQPAGNISPEDFNRYYNAINAFYDTNLVARGFNGAILVAKNGKVIFEKYHGYFNLAKKDTLNPHSSFHLASVSKTFTAMAILKLAEQGKLKLDDELSIYFPGFPYPGITIRMLLTHRSGLPNYLYFMEQMGWDKKVLCDNEDILKYLIQYQPPLTHKAGTHFSYCNTNYTLLGLIIEKVSGKTYGEYLNHVFFTPLHMNDTYVYSLSDSQRAMPSYNWKGQQEQFTYLDIGYGDKNIYSTPRDLLKWDQALYNNQLFSAETLESAFRPYSNEKPGIRNYGFGWRMNIYPNGKKIIFHGGWWHGNNTMLMRLTQDSATIIILGNKYNRNVYEAKKLANIFSPYFESDEEERSENNKEVGSNSDNILDAARNQKSKRNR